CAFAPASKWVFDSERVSSRTGTLVTDPDSSGLRPNTVRPETVARWPSSQVKTRRWPGTLMRVDSMSSSSSAAGTGCSTDGADATTGPGAVTGAASGVGAETGSTGADEAGADEAGADAGAEDADGVGSGG